MAKGMQVRKPCNKPCSPGTKLNPITCECVKIKGVPRPPQPFLQPPSPPKGKKGLIIKSKKNK